MEGNASGEVLVCEAPRSFSLTWESMGSTSWVEVDLTVDGIGRPPRRCRRRSRRRPSRGWYWSQNSSGTWAVCTNRSRVQAQPQQRQVRAAESAVTVFYTGMPAEGEEGEDVPTPSA